MDGHMYTVEYNKSEERIEVDKRHVRWIDRHI